MWSLASLRPAVSGTCSFWLNGIDSFPGFDFAWLDVVSRTICLISVSISSVPKHEKDKEFPLKKVICNSYDVGAHKVEQPGISNDSTTKSSTVKLLSWLTGITWQTRYNVLKQEEQGDEGKTRMTPSKKRTMDTLDAIMEPSTPNDQRWALRILFFSGQHENQASSTRLMNLLVAGPAISAAFRYAPIDSVNQYLNKVEQNKQTKALKLHGAEEQAEAPPRKKAKPTDSK